MGAPNFWETFSEAITLSAKDRGIMAYCPWLLMLIAITGFVLSLFALAYGADFGKSDTVAALAAMMVAAGFLGAVSVGGMNQIFATLIDEEFSEYLQDIKAFDQFLAWPQIIYLVQMTYFVASALSILLVCICDANEIRVITLCVMGITTIYVSNKTWHLIDLLRILAWHRQDYARQLREAKTAAGLN